eukprot:9788184-Heterocapsa_arctica.AAC.1
MKCRFCAHALKRAQEDLSVYDEAVDAAARKRESQRRSLYKDQPAGASASAAPARSKSQDPGNFGPDQKA